MNNNMYIYQIHVKHTQVLKRSICVYVFFVIVY